MKSTPGDGLALAAFRLVLGLFLLAWTAAVFAPLLRRLERPATAIARRMNGDATPTDVYWVGIDLYKLLMTAVGVVCYLAVWAARGAEPWGRVVGGTAGVVAAVLLVEFVAVNGILFFHRPGGAARASYRPLANAFWSFFEVATLYGVLFAALAAFEPGAVAANGECVTNTFLGPLYFSVITLATVGYGDFAPRTGLARGLVIAEIATGLFLTVAIIQKALQRSPGPTRTAGETDWT